MPQGTIISVRLNTTLSSRKTKADTAISARVMQSVPLPDGGRIPEGTRVTGHLIDVRPASSGSPASLSFVFDRMIVSKKVWAITTNLRALASVPEVDSAYLPETGMGEGDTWSSRTTMQVGGDEVYWGGGPVVSRFGPVGKPILGADSGVLVKVSANPGGGCRGEIGDNHALQAFWVFSSDACGVYGFDDLSIAHAGKTEPFGVVEFTSRSGEIKVLSGSGMLLRVIAPGK